MQDTDWSRLIAMRQVIVVAARTNELLAETALHRGLHRRLVIFRDPDLAGRIPKNAGTIWAAATCSGDDRLKSRTRHRAGAQDVSVDHGFEARSYKVAQDTADSVGGSGLGDLTR